MKHWRNLTALAVGAALLAGCTTNPYTGEREAGKAGILGLGRTYLFSIPLLFVLPHIFGETGIWMAAPTADVAMVGLIAVVLGLNAAKRGWRFGLLQPL